MTTLESLASLGEIIGAVAVVVSLVYLAVQVRQNTQAQQTENFSRALDRVASIQATLSQDARMSVVITKGVTDPAELTARERLQFTWAMYELFGAFEFMFLAARTKAMPDEVWRRWSAAVAWWLGFSGVQTWWKAKPTPFTDSFTSYIDYLLRDNPTDAESTRRFQDFLAQGKLQA